MKTKIKNIKKEMMSRIDITNSLEVRKVERYCELLELDEQLSKCIEMDGATIETVNGSQRFIKSNPAIGDKVKISKELSALEKSIIFLPRDTPKVIDMKSSSTVELKQVGGGLI